MSAISGGDSDNQTIARSGIMVNICWCYSIRHPSRCSLGLTWLPSFAHLCSKGSRSEPKVPCKPVMLAIDKCDGDRLRQRACWESADESFLTREPRVWHCWRGLMILIHRCYSKSCVARRQGPKCGICDLIISASSFNLILSSYAMTSANNNDKLGEWTRCAIHIL